MPEPIREQVERLGGIGGLARLLPDEREIVRTASAHRALADPVRLAVLHLLVKQPLCVCLIRDVLGVPDSRLSYHLSVLADAGLIEGDRRGNWIIYRATDEGGRYVPGPRGPDPCRGDI